MKISEALLSAKNSLGSIDSSTFIFINGKYIHSQLVVEKLEEELLVDDVLVVRQGENEWVYVHGEQNKEEQESETQEEKNNN